MSSNIFEGLTFPSIDELEKLRRDYKLADYQHEVITKAIVKFQKELPACKLINNQR